MLLCWRLCSPVLLERILYFLICFLVIYCFLGHLFLVICTHI